jgi:hypothetical protein
VLTPAPQTFVRIFTGGSALNMTFTGMLIPSHWLSNFIANISKML